ncbi:hypothetical protein [uncultured Algibacter sp.]|uniref:toxin-antitoxin system YwqK family antitoxin n=1 Tax=uncultured Algibacter sp. TaxID=298659 RepID=UPI0032166E25
MLLFSVFTGCNDTEDLILHMSAENYVLNNGILEFEEKSFSGKLVCHFPNGQIKYESLYKNGKKEGHERHWLDDGTLVEERFYTNGLKTGVHRAWWTANEPKFEYHFNNKGEFNGLVKEWYKSGLPYQDFNYVNGKEVGSQRMWKPNGKLKTNYMVVNGERFGLIGIKKCYTVTIDKDEIN